MRVGANQAFLVSDVNREIDVLANDAPEHVLDIPQQSAEVEHLLLNGLMTAESEQLPGEARGAPRRAQDLLHVSGDALGRRAAETLERQLSVSGNHGQEVIEIMRHAARQTAERLHLAGLCELLFQHAA